MDLRCQDIHYTAGGQEILKGISLTVDGARFHTILGPNGCGKTSLLKTIYRMLHPTSGTVYLDERPLDSIRVKDSAQQVAVVTQSHSLQFDCTVEEVVLLGRTPHIPFLQREGEEDHAIVRKALKQVGMFDKRKQSYHSLSGGEKQRTVLARALAQEPTLLLLDEPTNHLDIKYQLDILNIVKQLNMNVLAVLHDIQLACRYSDYIYLMKGGEILYQGPPQEAITGESLQEVFEVPCTVSWTADHQAMIHYL